MSLTGSYGGGLSGLDLSKLGGSLGNPRPQMPQIGPAQPSPYNAGPPINTGRPAPSFGTRLRQNLPGMMTNFSQMMANRSQPMPQMQQQEPQGSMFQRAFARAMPMQQPMPNRRTDMSQFFNEM